MAREAKVRASKEYVIWRRNYPNIPAQPKHVYKEWVDWYTFLGTNKIERPKVKPVAKLKENEVLIIKHQLQLDVPAVQLAKLFGVSDMQIIRIKRGENRTNVKL